MRLPQLDTILRLPDGRVVADKAALNSYGFTLMPNLPNNKVSFNAGRAAQPMIFSLAGSEGPFLGYKLAAEITGNCLVRFLIRDGSYQRELQNLPVHASAIFGTGAQPYYLPMSLYIEENSVIEMQVSDISLSNNSITPNIQGARFRSDMTDFKGQKLRDRVARRQFVSLPYFYVPDGSVATSNGGISVGGSATVNAPISIGSDHAFEILQISAVSTGAFTLDLVNQATGESIVNAQGNQHYGVPSQLLVGNNLYPFRLHEPFFVNPGQKLMATIVDTSGSTNVVYLVLCGRLIQGSPRR